MKSGKALPEDHCAHRDERFGVAPTRAPTPTALPASGSKSLGDDGNSAVDGTTIVGGTVDEQPVEAVSEALRSAGDKSALDNGASLTAAATAVRQPLCTVVAETPLSSAAQSTNTAQAISTALFPLSGNFSDGVAPCSILGQHAAICTTERGTAISAPSARHGANGAAETVKDLIELGNSKRDNLLCVKDLQRPMAVKRSHIRRNEPRFAPGVTIMSSETRSAFASAPFPSSRSFTKKNHAVPDPGVGLKPARIEQGLPFDTAENKGGLERLIDKTPVADEVDKDQPRSFHRDLSSDRDIPVPVPPPYDPSSWEDPQDTLMGIRPYRSGVLASVTTVASERRREQQQRGPTQPLLFIDSCAGTVAAVAVKDVHNVTPPVSVPALIIRPYLVEDLMTFVSQPLRYPSPPVSRNNCRAFGVISPFSWSADSVDRRVTCTPQPAGDQDTPREAVSQRGGSSPCGNRHIKTSSQSNNLPNNSFFPVRPRAGRRVPGPSSAGLRRWLKPDLP